MRTLRRLLMPDEWITRRIGSAGEVAMGHRGSTPPCPRRSMLLADISFSFRAPTHPHLVYVCVVRSQSTACNPRAFLRLAMNTPPLRFLGAGLAPSLKRCCLCNVAEPYNTSRSALLYLLAAAEPAASFNLASSRLSFCACGAFSFAETHRLDISSAEAARRNSSAS